MRIRNRKTYFSSLPEGYAPKSKKKKISTYVYFSIIIIVLLYLIYYSAMKFLYIERRGQVEIGRYLVYSSIEGTIDKLYVKKGDKIKKLQPLGRVVPSSTKAFQNSKREILHNRVVIKNLENRLAGLLSRKRYYLSDKVLKIENDIRLKNVELNSTREKRYSLLKDWRKREKVIIRERLLELNRFDPEESIDIKREKKRLDAIIRSLRKEVKSLKKYRVALLRKEINDLRLLIAEKKTRINPMDLDPQAETLISPIDGFVQAIIKTQGSQTFPKESILAIRTKLTKVSIHGFFQSKHLSSLIKGKKVVILFPDNTKSEGVIANNYAISSYYREKLKSDYVPIKSEVLVNIVPVNKSDEEKWRKFDRMDVRIRLRK